MAKGAKRAGPGRSRNQNGRWRAKRRDTHNKTIEGIYGLKLRGRSDKHLGTTLAESGDSSLSQMLRI